MAPGVTRRNFLGTTGTLAAGLTSGAAMAAGSAQAAETAVGDRLKVLGIGCSHRKGRTTSTALGVCLEAARAVDPRIDVELIELAGLKIPGHVAAGVPLEPGERDDFPQVANKIADPALAALILATPVYFGNMSSPCKALIERCTIFHTDHSPLTNKVAGVLAVGGGRNGGVELTVRSVQVALMSLQMIVVGDARPTGHWGGTAWSGAEAVKNTKGPDITRDELGMATMKNLGRRVAEMTLRLAGCRAC